MQLFQHISIQTRHIASAREPRVTSGFNAYLVFLLTAPPQEEVWFVREILRQLEAVCMCVCGGGGRWVGAEQRIGDQPLAQNSSSLRPTPLHSEPGPPAG